LFAGVDLPAGGSDYDVLALGIGEVDEDAGGEIVLGAEADAAKDGGGAVGELAGQGLEVIEDGVHGVGGGEGLVMSDGLVDEPIAELRGAEGQGESAGFGHADEYLAVVVDEGHASLDDFPEACEVKRFEHRGPLNSVVARRHCGNGLRRTGFVENNGNIVEIRT